MAQELPGGHNEGALLRVESNFVFLEAIKCLAQVLRMVDGSMTLHEHVINEYLHRVSISSLKTLLTIRWKVAPTFFSPKRHHLIAIDSPIGDERRLVFVWWIHLNLIVSEV